MPRSFIWLDKKKCLSTQYRILLLGSSQVTGFSQYSNRKAYIHYKYSPHKSYWYISQILKEMSGRIQKKKFKTSSPSKRKLHKYFQRSRFDSYFNVVIFLQCSKFQVFNATRRQQLNTLQLLSVHKKDIYFHNMETFYI